MLEFDACTESDASRSSIGKVIVHRCVKCPDVNRREAHRDDGADHARDDADEDVAEVEVGDGREVPDRRGESKRERLTGVHLEERGRFATNFRSLEGIAPTR